MNMQCDQFEQAFEQQDDNGRLQAQSLAHIETCEACRALMADLGAIREMAAGLDADGATPPERVWISLRNQLEAEGIIREAQPAEFPRMPDWWIGFQRPAVAGAFLSLMLIGATLISYQWGSPLLAVHPQFVSEQEASSVPSADSVFKEEVLTVGDESFQGPQRQDTAVTGSIRRNLRIVDNFIAMCEESVREQPDNRMAREYLYGAYQQKAELLATATNRSMTGGLQ